MRHFNTILFVIVVAIILFSVLRAVFSASPQEKRHEPGRSPSVTAQAPARHG